MSKSVYESVSLCVRLDLYDDKRHERDKDTRLFRVLGRAFLRQIITHFADLLES